MLFLTVLWFLRVAQCLLPRDYFITDQRELWRGNSDGGDGIEDGSAGNLQNSEITLDDRASSEILCKSSILDKIYPVMNHHG
jgi:hypothetical protein